MKKITILLLCFVFVFSQSFIGNNTALKNAPNYTLTIDGAPFDAKTSDNYSAQLINNSRTASITFTGNELRDKKGNVYPTKIQIDYTLRGETLGEVNVEKVVYEYNNQTYHALPGTAFVSITKMKWATDKKSFVINADIFCKVQKSYIMEEFVPVFVIRGSVQNLTVVAPVS